MFHYIATATPLGNYPDPNDPGKSVRLWAFCIHTATRGSGQNFGSLPRTQLPWHLLRVEEGCFPINVADPVPTLPAEGGGKTWEGGKRLKSLPLPEVQKGDVDRETLISRIEKSWIWDNKVPAPESRQWRKADGSAFASGLYAGKREEQILIQPDGNVPQIEIASGDLSDADRIWIQRREDLLSSDKRSLNLADHTKLPYYLFSIQPQPGQEIDDGPSETPRATAFLGGLVQQSFPVPQQLGLTIFYAVPETDGSTDKKLLFCPAFHESSVPRFEYEGELDKRDCWKVSWAALPDLDLRVMFYRKPVYGDAAFLDVSTVRGRDPGSSRPWSQELPLHFGKVLNPAEWLASRWTESDIEAAKNPAGLCDAAFALLHDRIHLGDLNAGLASSLGPGSFAVRGGTLSPFMGLIADSKYRGREKPVHAEWRLAVLLTLRSRMPASEPEILQELKLVETTSDEQNKSIDDGLAKIAADPKQAAPFITALAAMAVDDDCVLDLLARSVTNGPGEQASFRAELEAKAQESGRRISEHFGDVWTDHLWGEVSQAFNDATLASKQKASAEGAKPATGKAGDPLFPLHAAVTRALDSYFDRREKSGLFLTLPDAFKDGALIKPAAVTGGPLDLVGRIAGVNTEAKTIPPESRPHPLSLLVPDLDLEAFKGMAIFGRAGIPGAAGGGVDTGKWGPWCCLTWGRLSHLLPENGDLHSVEVNGSGGVTAFSPDAANGLDQAWLHYRTRHLGVDQTGGEGDGASVDPLDPAAAFKDCGFRISSPLQYADDPARSWGLIPGLRHSQSLAYQFSFAAIHNSGALPPGLAMSGVPCTLVPPSDFRAPSQTSEVLDIRYRRRVPVGPLRPALRIKHRGDAGRGAKEGEEKSFALPELPAGVAFLADDLLKPAHGVDARPVSRPPLLFLRASFPEVTFFLRSPAIDREIWRSWMMGEEARVPRQTAKRVASVHAGCAGLPAGFLDDPAVSAVHISICPIYPDPKAEGAAVLVPIGPGDDLHPAFDDSKPMADLIESCYQYRLGKFIRIIRLGEDAGPEKKPTVEDAGDEVRISIPAGSVVALRMTPCLSGAALNRFDIYPAEGNSVAAESVESALPPSTRMTKLTGGKEVLYRLDRAALNWRIETTPTAARLPSASEIWSALRLDRATADPKLVEGRLRAKLSPLGDDKDGRAKRIHTWSWVSEVMLSVQKWRWNGLPQTACGPWDRLDPAALKERNGLKADPPLLAKGMTGLLELIPEDDPEALSFFSFPVKDLESCEVAEIPGFAGRADTDCGTYRSRVNFASELITPSGAAVAMLHTEAGDAESIPVYYRVAITVAHRYQVLPEFRDALVPPYLRGASNNEGTGTPWQRLLLKSGPPPVPIPPRVKLVLPLMDTEAPAENSDYRKKAATGLPKRRPGFVVMTRDTLPSPFHRLVANIEVASRIEYPKRDPQTPVDTRDIRPVAAKLLHEIGPDALTARSGSGLSPIPIMRDGGSVGDFHAAVEKAIAHEVNLTRVEGQAFGLTFEREASSPLFPHAGFHFDLNYFVKCLEKSGLSVALLDGHDVQLKLRFHWEVDRRAIWPGPAQDLTSERSAAWWVSALAPFDLDGPVGPGERFVYRDRPGKGSEVDLSKITPKLPKQSTGEGDLVTALFFLCWADVADAAGGPAAKVLTDIFLVSDPTPLEPPLPVFQQAPPAPVTRGQFMVLRYRTGKNSAAGTLGGRLSSEMKKTDARISAARLEVLVKMLFPEPAGAGEGDAEAMVVRCSPPVDGYYVLQKS